MKKINDDETKKTIKKVNAKNYDMNIVSTSKSTIEITNDDERKPKK